MYILFDVGGTSTRVASSRDGKKIDRVLVRPTPKKFAAGVKLIENLAAELVGKRRVRAVAGGVPGPLDTRKTKMTKASNLPDWSNKPLKSRLQKIFGGPILLENDSVLAGLGEATCGAGRGKRVVAYITISTGIGGARFVDGKADAYGAGFEPGHQLITFEGRPTNFEACASGTALKKRHGKSAQDITSAKVWNEEVQLVAQGLANTIVHWSPDVVVLGGGVGREELPIERVNSRLKEIVTIFPTVPRVVRAKLGDRAGLKGALAVLREAKIG